MKQVGSLRHSETALEQLHELRDTAVSKVGKQLAKIFDIHMVLTLDDDFSDAVRSIISTQRVNAEYAVSLASDNFSKIFAAMNDDYMKARSADIHDIIQTGPFPFFRAESKKAQKILQQEQTK